MAWLIIVVAGVFETVFAVLLKQSRGMTIALRKLEVGPALACERNTVPFPTRPPLT